MITMEIDLPTDDDIEKSAHATLMSGHVCECCGNLTLFLYDKDRKLVAHARLSPEMWFNVTDNIANQFEEWVVNERAVAEPVEHTH